jgi:hypothetical protein
MKNYHYIDSDKQTKGPFTIEQLIELARTGVIGPETMIAGEGDSGWIPYQQLIPDDRRNQFMEWLKKALTAFKQFATDPVGGMPDACKSLDSSSAMGVGIVFGTVFVVCVFVFVYGIVPAEVLKQMPMLNMLLATAVPFVCVAAASFLARSVFRGKGTLGSDCFIAGAALLPSAFLLLLARFFGVVNVGVVATLLVFVACLTILMLYTGCNRISGLSERTATFAVPLMLIASAWLARILYGSLFFERIVDQIKEQSMNGLKPPGF